MKKGSSQLAGIALFLSVILCLSAILPTSIAFGTQNDEPRHVPGQLLIKFEQNTPENVQQAIFRTHGAELIDTIPQIDVKILKVPENALDRIESALESNNVVEYVEKDFILEPLVVPDDTYFSNQWHLSKIGAPSAWDISQGTANIAVAVLDSGVDPNHPDLASKLLPGYNYYDNNNNSADVCGHGTKVAGSAAAITNNGLGVAGVAWNNMIIPVRITDTACYGYYSAMAKGIIFAADNGARVANISFRIFNGSTLTDAAKYMYDKGGWVVAAGGNTGIYESYTDNPYIISVSATASNDVVTTFSSYGPYIDFAAPGSGIYTTVMGGSYGSTSGTSFSSPITAGLIALMFSQNPSMTPSQVYDAMKQSAVDLGTSGYDYYYGWGRIDAFKALQVIAGNPIDNSAPTVSITSPSDGSTVSDIITVGVSATDNVGVSKVELYVDNMFYGQSLSSPYSFVLDTTTLPNGSHGLKAMAYDTSSNSASSQITVNVSNVSVSIDTIPPTVSISNPSDGSIVKGRVTVSVSASDGSGVSKVEIYIDNTLKATLTYGPYDFSWNTRSVKNGTHSITAIAYDMYGNSASISTNVTVSNGK